MQQNNRLTSALLLLPAVLLAGGPALIGKELHRSEEKTIRIVNHEDSPLEISESEAMAGMAHWQRNPKGLGGPRRSQAKAGFSPRKWVLNPGRTARIVITDSSPFYVLDFSSGERKVQCTFDNFGGTPLVLGKQARLTEAGNAYSFAFKDPAGPQLPMEPAVDLDPEAVSPSDPESHFDPHPSLTVSIEPELTAFAEPGPDQEWVFVPAPPQRLSSQEKAALKALAEPAPKAPARPERPTRQDPAARVAAVADYRQAIGAPESLRLADLGGRSNPVRRVPVQEATGRPRLKGPAASAGKFKPMASIAEHSGKQRKPSPGKAEATPTRTVATQEAVAQNQSMLDFYAGF